MDIFKEVLEDGLARIDTLTDEEIARAIEERDAAEAEGHTALAAAAQERLDDLRSALTFDDPPVPRGGFDGVLVRFDGECTNESVAAAFAGFGGWHVTVVDGHGDGDVVSGLLEFDFDEDGNLILVLEDIDDETGVGTLHSIAWAHVVDITIS